MLIFLIGFMGSGKSHVGRELARLMRYKFVDTDELVEKKSRMTIKNIFEKRGEEFFREKEMKVLHELVKAKRAVVATGGGMPCFFDNMEVMNKHGVTIYLEASAGLLFHRLVNEKEKRPLIKDLKTVDLMDFISQKLEERREYYEKAKIKVNADTITAAKLKTKISKLIS